MLRHLSLISAANAGDRAAQLLVPAVLWFPYRKGAPGSIRKNAADVAVALRLVPSAICDSRL